MDHLAVESMSAEEGSQSTVPARDTTWDTAVIWEEGILMRAVIGAEIIGVTDFTVLSMALTFRRTIGMTRVTGTIILDNMSLTEITLTTSQVTTIFTSRATSTTTISRNGFSRPSQAAAISAAPIETLSDTMFRFRRTRAMLRPGVA